MYKSNSSLMIGGHIQGIGIDLMSDGTKMFTIYRKAVIDNKKTHFINEYNLSTPFDVSTRVYAVK